MTKIGYLRVSALHQNLARQIEMAKQIGIDDEYIFVEKASGKNAQRTELKRMLSFVRKGDTVYCESISRIARNTKDFLNIIDELNNKGVAFVSMKENIDTNTPTGKFMLTVFSALAELERESILDRQREGIEVAKRENKYKGRQPMEIDWNRFAVMCAEWRKGERTAVSIQRHFNITATTFYRWVKERDF